MAQIKISTLKLLGSFLLIVISSLHWGCDTKNYILQKDFEAACWSMNDTLTFELESSETKKLGLFIQFNEEYSYQNLYLKLLYQKPGAEQQEILLNQLLMDKMGVWVNSEQGKPFQIHINKAFEIAGANAESYQCSLIQYMREENLCGIEEIGVLGIP